MKNPNSRNRVYKRIAQIYELTGRILMAGKYYEKAAYVFEKDVDYYALLESYYMLYEMGFNESVNSYLNNLNISDLNSRELSVYNNLITIVSGDSTVSTIQDDSIYWHIKNSGMELKTPGYFIGMEPAFNIYKVRGDKIEYKSIVLGSFKTIPPGIINILEQLNLIWIYEDEILEVLTDNRINTMKILEKAGLNYENIR